MREHELLDEVQRHAGLATPEQAADMTRVVLGALGESLDAGVAGALAGELPPGMADWVRPGVHGQGGETRDLVARVASRAALAEGIAVEITGGVVRALGALVSPALRETLAAGLPPGLGDLLEPPPPGLVHPPGGHTLASGRPGASHPLAEAAPPAGQSRSPARTDQAKAETQVSTSEGLRQERLGRTLAEGAPGSDRPISEKR